MSGAWQSGTLLLDGASETPARCEVTPEHSMAQLGSHQHLQASGLCWDPEEREAEVRKIQHNAGHSCQVWASQTPAPPPP